jgi:hypothetical protein
MSNREWCYFSDELPTTDVIDIIYYHETPPDIVYSVNIEQVTVNGVYVLMDALAQDVLLETDDLDTLNGLVQWRPSLVVA